MDSIETCRREITAYLEKVLAVHLPSSPKAQEVYRYALLPPGKLFRPLLARGIALDKQNYLENSHPHFELFLEIHHVYTLVHDDLPCMDDDAIRRGRPATHLRFGEWQALLGGDGLNTLSYRLLSLIQSPRLPLLLQYVTWALGPKGLILGQYRDLSTGASRNDLSEAITTHKLKTSRLIQVALVGSALLTERADWKGLKNLHRLGEALGLSFQLLDDLEELGGEELSPQEARVNPFLTHGEQCARQLQGHLEKVEEALARGEWESTKRVLREYLEKVNASLEQGGEIICGRAKEVSLSSIQQTLHGLSL